MDSCKAIRLPVRFLDFWSISPLLGIPKGVCSGVFIAENAHRYGSPTPTGKML